MEHILQFGIAIDDEAIRRNIEASAIENLSKKLTQDIEGALGVGTNIYGGGKYCTSDSKLVDIVNDTINKVIEDNKDYILNRVIDEVSGKLARSKTFKENLLAVAEHTSNEKEK